MIVVLYEYILSFVAKGIKMWILVKMNVEFNNVNPRGFDDKLQALSEGKTVEF